MKTRFETAKVSVRVICAVGVFAALTVAACTDEAPAPEEAEPSAAVEEPAAETSVAIVKELHGVLRQGEKVLSVGDTAALNSELVLEKGRAVLDLPGVGTLRLYPGAQVQLTNRRTVRLLIGKVWALVTKLTEDSFEVETENAVAGVRGTQFLVELTGQKTRVAVTEGKVAVRSKKVEAPEVVVEAGQQSEVTEASAPTPPEAYAPAADQQAWEEATSIADAAPGEEPEIEPQATPEPVSPTPAPADSKAKPVGPKPGVKVDREAFEEQEAQGEAQRQQLQEEAKEQKEELKQEEEKVRKEMEASPEEQQRKLEEDMGRRGTLKPTPSKPQPSKTKRGKSDEMRDFLR